MKIKIIFISIFFILFLSSLGYSLECSYNGRVEKVEFSLDDNTFSHNFNGTNGIINRLTYNSLNNEYNLWQTNLLPKRNDKGNVIQQAVASMNLDSSSLAINNQMIIINTSKYNTIYQKIYFKNLGSCITTFTNSVMDDYMKETGGTDLNTGPWSFFSDIGRKKIDIKPTEIKYEIGHQNINGYYSGIFQVGSSIFNKNQIYQWFYTNFWFDGPIGFGYPKLIAKTSYNRNPLNIGDPLNISVKYKNDYSVNKNVTYRFYIYDYQYPTNYHAHNNYKELTGFFVVPSKKIYNLNLNSIVNSESNYNNVNTYFSCLDIKYYDAIFNKSLLISHYCGYWGSLLHPFLNPEVPTGIQLGTTNNGIPYIGAQIEFKEYNKFNPQNIPANSFNREINIKRNNGTGWINYFTNMQTISHSIAANSKYKEDYKYEIYDFSSWENIQANIYISTIWNGNNLYQYRFPSFSSIMQEPPLNLDFSHLLMSTDLPLYFYPNGGSDKLNIRDVLFNLKDYKLRNVSLNTKIIDPISGIVSSDFNINNPSNFDVPAKSSYPIPITIKYKGPIVNKKYLIMINYSYYDEINNLNVSKMLYGDIYIKSNHVEKNYYDLIIKKINYGNLYVKKKSKVIIDFVNQGNAPILSSNKVSLYYKNFTESNFHLIGSKIVSKFATNVSFNYTPTKTGSQILKAVVDEDNNINENSIYSIYGEKNNALASITFVRDLDVVLDYAKPLYKQIVNEGVIPFEIKIHNAGVGGIDKVNVDLNISWMSKYWYFNHTYYNIPKNGRIFKYYWNVTNVTPGVHIFNAKALPLYDSNYSNNIKTGAMDFCALPWYSSPLDCFSNCDNTCLDKFNMRYKASCNGINGCKYFSEDFAKSCEGYTKNSYVEFNSTHVALCPDASITRLKMFTETPININGNCTDIIIKKSPTILQGKFILMDLITCKH